MPLMATATSALLWRMPPCAMAQTVASLTAPRLSMMSRETPTDWTLASLE